MLGELWLRGGVGVAAGVWNVWSVVEMRLGLAGGSLGRAPVCPARGLHSVLWTVSVSSGYIGTVSCVWERLRRETSELQFAGES